MTALSFSDIVAFIALAVTAINVIYGIISSRAKATKEELDTIHERLNGQGNRITAVEEQMKHLPTATAMQEMAEKTGELHGDFRELLGEFKAMKRQVNNIDEFLRKKGESVMSDFEAHLAEDRRLVILRLLHQDTAYTLNDRVIQIGLRTLGHDVTLDTVRADLAKLKDLGALTFQVISNQVFVAKLTRSGLDHVERRHAIPGVKRPSPE